MTEKTERKLLDHTDIDLTMIDNGSPTKGFDGLNRSNTHRSGDDYHPKKMMDPKEFC